jgi:hypothetical protein
MLFHDSEKPSKQEYDKDFAYKYIKIIFFIF